MGPILQAFLEAKVLHIKAFRIW